MHNCKEGKLFILAVSGGRFIKGVEEHFNQFFDPFDVEVLDFIKYQSEIMPCFNCGRHKTCTIGGLYEQYGKKAHKLDITQDMYNTWEDNFQVMSQIEAAAEKLKNL